MRSPDFGRPGHGLSHQLFQLHDLQYDQFPADGLQAHHYQHSFDHAGVRKAVQPASGFPNYGQPRPPGISRQRRPPKKALDSVNELYSQIFFDFVLRRMKKHGDAEAINQNLFLYTA